MAAADTLQYYPQITARSGIPVYPLSQTHSNPASPQSFAALQNQWSMPAFREDSFSYPISPMVAPAGTTHATNPTSSHGKLHKRALAKQPRGKSKHDDSQSPTEVALTRTKTPPASAGATPVEGPRSPSIKSATRGILKQNLRKFSHHNDDADFQNTIDLSRTIEENEKRSGLGITTSRSTSDIRNTTGVHRGHTRSHSHNSNLSTGSGLYSPSVPYVLPSRELTRPYTPPLHRNYTAASDGLDFSGDAYASLADEVTFRTRDASSTSFNSPVEIRPRLRLNTGSSAPPISGRPNFSQNPSMVSLDRTSTRPRRSTNPSVHSGAIADGTMTPRSKASADARAFSFLSRAKDREAELDPALLRLNSIQAARQAFEDREEYKNRKYELQEQKAQDKQQRKIAKIEERKRRKSDAAGGLSATTPPAAASSPWEDAGRADFVSGGEYASVTSLPFAESSPGAEYAAAMALGQHIRSSDAATTTTLSGQPRTSKRHAAKITYVQFLTWMRTKFLNADRRRRQQQQSRTSTT